MVKVFHNGSKALVEVTESKTNDLHGIIFKGNDDSVIRMARSLITNQKLH